ncbi:Pepsin A [Psilocybe cubensis]|uniref:Pepsin A n=2 Tax=Psilocybe cubensis TaxID=181762 RepID=A0ACB8GMS2_PSICU|nr:Pepsin A [Psilocybe cubensis]KAH9476976.1 Pepsin A [Psilocybe cubensis]
MHLSLSFTTILTSVLFVMFAQVAESAPVTKRAPTPPKFVTLPLKRAERTRDVHGQIYLQQHINRGLRRMARMRGHEAPSARDLHTLLERRVRDVEGVEGLSRRFNRFGLPAPAAHSSAHEAVSLAEAPKQNDALIDDGVTVANTPTAPNSLGLDIEAVDVGYSAVVQIGTPPRDFLVTMDSGSSDFWVGSEDCTSNGIGCGNHVFLGPQSSTSFNDTGKPFKITYGSGSVSGNIITDDVTIAGLALPAHTFGVASIESVEFSAQSPDDGLMGTAKSVRIFVV